MRIDRYLESLSQTEHQARKAALEAALREENLPYTVQSGSEPHTGRPVQNYMVYPAELGPCPMFCAHYDACPGSPGANDNAASLCILIELAVFCRENRIPAAFCFLDGEECGHLGAKLLEKNRSREFSVVVNLDMCGYGDTIALYAKGGRRKPAAAVFLQKKRMQAHHVREVNYLPEGDDRCFSTGVQPVFSLAVMPFWDTRYLDAIAAHGNLLGNFPEASLILEQMEVISTMHGGWRDQIKWVQPEAMQMVYDYLSEVLCAPAAAEHFRFPGK